MKKKLCVGISLQRFKPSRAFNLGAFKSSKHSCAYNIGINCWKKKVHQLFKLTDFRSYVFHVCLRSRTGPAEEGNKRCDRPGPKPVSLVY